MLSSRDILKLMLPMSKVNLSFQSDGDIHQFDIDLEATKVVQEEDDGIDEMNIADISVQLDRARAMIRDYTEYAIGAFKDFAAAEVEEVTLKFGLKLGGKMGIPYITEGSAESNLEISVKCKFSPKS